MGGNTIYYSIIVFIFTYMTCGLKVLTQALERFGIQICSHNKCAKQLVRLAACITYAAAFESDMQQTCVQTKKKNAPAISLAKIANA